MPRATGVFSRKSVPGWELVELGSPCERHWLLVNPKAVQDHNRFGVKWTDIGPSSTAPAPDRWRARSGAAVYWRDGSRAGAIGSFVMPLDGPGTMVGARRCFERSLRPDGWPWGSQEPAVGIESALREAAFSICFDDADLVMWPSEWPDARAAKIGSATRHYLTVTTVTHAGQDAKALDAMVKKTLKNALLINPSVALAPGGESPEESKRKALEHRVRVHRIVVDLAVPDYQSRPRTTTEGGRRVQHSGSVVQRGKLEVVDLATGVVELSDGAEVLSATTTPERERTAEALHDAGTVARILVEKLSATLGLGIEHVNGWTRQ
jgi:hypothetical protein